MKKNKILLSLFSSFTFLFFFNILINSCASVSTPSGGDKDTLSPTIVKSIPEHQSLEYTGKILVLFFSEEVKTKNLSQELLSTPPLPPYKLKEVKNRIEIRFLEEPLKDSTTYSLNFRGGIVDLTEENIAFSEDKKTLRLAFSTWNQIDSMIISGNVTKRLTEEVAENALIALYPVDDTLEVGTDKPYYFTLTDEKGDFRIENIKAGEYKVYAIQDNNQNYHYDEGEGIDFLIENLILKDTIKPDLEFKLVKEDHSPPEIVRGRVKDKYFEIHFDEGLTDVFIDSAKNEKKFAYNLIEKGQKVRFYNTEEIYDDTLAVNIIAIDSLGNRLEAVDSIFFKQLSEKEQKRRDKASKKTRKVFDPSVKLNSGTGIEKSVLDLSVEFEVPVKIDSLEKITYYPDKDTLNVEKLIITKDDFQWNHYRTKLSIKKELKFKESVNILLDSLAFITLEDDTSNAITQNFKQKANNKFGIIGGKVQTDKENYIVQVVSEKWEIIQEAINPKKFYFEFLPAGKYTLRVVIDRNGNGKWDSSDYKNNVPAEEVLFFYKNEKLRENWELPDRDIKF